MGERTGAGRPLKPLKAVVSSAGPRGALPLGEVMAAAGIEVARVCVQTGDAGDLRDVLDAARQLGADVAVVELGRGGPGGSRLLKAVEGSLPCPLLVVAEWEDGNLLLASVQAGATGFVVRRGGDPSFRDELVAAILAVRRGETVVPSRMLGGLLADLIRWSRDRDRAAREADRLSGRQRAVLLLLGSGASMGTIAGALGVSVYTVRSHVQELLRKIEVHSRAEALLWAARNGVLDQLRREADLARADGAPGILGVPSIRGGVL